MTDSRSDDIRALMVESARVQVAAMSGAIAFWTGWVEAAGKFVQATSRELATVADPEAKVDSVMGRLTDSTQEYLRHVTELPNIAVAQFNAELQATDAARRTTPNRSVKAKD